MDTTLNNLNMSINQLDSHPFHSFLSVTKKRKQQNYDISSKNHYIKNLLVSPVSVVKVAITKTKICYTLSSPVYNHNLFLYLEKKTKMFSLYQGSHLLSDNQSVCTILHNKIKEKPGY